jgi:hypothetical protein
MKKTYQGELEIDMETGTIYFHNTRGRTILRVQGLPSPIPEKGFYEVKVKEASVSWESLALFPVKEE